MFDTDNLLRTLAGRSDDEKRDYLERNFNLYWGRQNGSCKVWYAKVFTYCNPNELEEQLNFFLFLVNVFGYLWNICFHEEDTVYLGCIPPCGFNQTILYYSITFED